MGTISGPEGCQTYMDWSGTHIVVKVEHVMPKDRGMGWSKRKDMKRHDCGLALGIMTTLGLYTKAAQFVVTTPCQATILLQRSLSDTL